MIIHNDEVIKVVLLRFAVLTIALCVESGRGHVCVLEHKSQDTKKK